MNDVEAVERMHDEVQGVLPPLSRAAVTENSVASDERLQLVAEIQT